MKYYKVLGLLACAVVAISCFLPWTFYPDLNKSFTGFFSEENMYGKPGKVFIFLAIISAALILINRIWAKRVLLFVAAINIAYLIKSYVLFTTCYSALCPVKQYGLYLLMAGTIMLMVVSIFPDMEVQSEENDH
ncbi:MAG: hypothetical protein ABIW47_06000 [Ginsengibacter sp.]|jgi:hypothetical protein